MATRFRHIGCTSVVIAYCGEVPLSERPILRSRDWAWPDGSNIKPYSVIGAECPDCGRRIAIDPRCIEPIPRG